MDSEIDRMVTSEYQPGVSALAAARQLCRSLDGAPNLKRLLEDMLSEFNRQSHEFVQQREAFREALAAVPKN